jgi:hypothetical protein
MNRQHAQESMPPVAVGGVGGSGTRLIAACLMQLGIYMGRDLNPANDNLWFTLLFKRKETLFATEADIDVLVEIFLKVMSGQGGLTDEQVDLVNDLASVDLEQHPSTWLKERAKSLLSSESALPPPVNWGWKEPNTHVVLQYLRPRIKGMKYIHVMRNGLDMSFSKNQNQLRLWGAYYLSEDCKNTPLYSLKYWCAVHRRVQREAQSMGSDFLLLNFDEFCLNPAKEIRRLLDFIGMEADAVIMDRLTALVAPPATIGRFKSHSLDLFDKEDIDYVASLGFDTELS